MSKLQTAVRYLSAVRLAGTRTEWVYFAAETHRFYQVTSSQLRDLAYYLDDSPESGYSMWIADTADQHVAMPEGWTP